MRPGGHIGGRLRRLTRGLRAAGPAAGRSVGTLTGTQLLAGFAIAAAYAALAYLGIEFATTTYRVSLLWPGAGFAVALVYLYGYRVLPAILVGYLAVILVYVPVDTALALSLGVLVGTAASRWLLRRLVDPQWPFGDPWRAIRFFLFGGLIATGITAAVGTALLGALAGAPGHDLPTLLRIWWVADAVGVLTVAPLVLAWACPQERRRLAARRGEFLLLLGLGAGASLVAFGYVDPPSLPGFRVEFAVLPFLIWAALRFQTIGVASVTALVATSAVAATLHFGAGPVIGGGALLSTQFLVGVTAASMLVLAAAMHSETAAREAAERASRAKTQFLANMNHELRTPLNAIVGFSEVIEQQMAGAVPPRYVEYASEIRRSGQHLSDLVTEILEFSRLDTGEMRLSCEEIALGPLAEECMRVIRASRDCSSITLENRIPDDLPALVADRQRVRQILLNLLGNAVKFSYEGGRVWLAAHVHGKGVIVEVADEGIGLDAADISRVTEPFVQVDARLNRRYGGTGLGLSLVKRFAELHGGTLRIRSTPGAGTVVTVSFPDAAAPASVERAA